MMLDERVASSAVDEHNLLDSKTPDTAEVRNETVDCIVVVVAVEESRLDWKGFRRYSTRDNHLALAVSTEKAAHLDLEQL